MKALSRAAAATATAAAATTTDKLEITTTAAVADPTFRPGGCAKPSHRTGGVDGGHPVAHVSRLPSSLGMDDDTPLAGAMFGSAIQYGA